MKNLRLSLVALSLAFAPACVVVTSGNGGSSNEPKPNTSETKKATSGDSTEGSTAKSEPAEPAEPETVGTGEKQPSDSGKTVPATAPSRTIPGDETVSNESTAPGTSNTLTAKPAGSGG